MQNQSVKEKRKETMCRTAKSYIELIEQNKWTVAFNHQIQKWTVQEEFQICGNIGEHHDLQTALGLADKQHAKNMSGIAI